MNKQLNSKVLFIGCIVLAFTFGFGYANLFYSVKPKIAYIKKNEEMIKVIPFYNPARGDFLAMDEKGKFYFCSKFDRVCTEQQPSRF
ncbi:MAG TPA: hypothetical protein ENI23_06940 [bacterium]|nr:hypothetical protein [bacterium]